MAATVFINESVAYGADSSISPAAAYGSDLSIDQTAVNGAYRQPNSDDEMGRQAVRSQLGLRGRYADIECLFLVQVKVEV